MTVLDPDNLADRVLAPACKRAGVEWAGFHTFRHTCASLLFAGGKDVKQIQQWLGHADPGFTLGRLLRKALTELTEESRAVSPAKTRRAAG